jgi:hypothetical protein
MKKMTKTNVGKIKLSQEEAAETSGLAVRSGVKAGVATSFRSFTPTSFTPTSFTPTSFVGSFIG